MHQRNQFLPGTDHMVSIPRSETEAKSNLIIPGLGEFQSHLDRVRLVSSRRKGTLDYRLPIKELKQASSSFHIHRHTGNPYYNSNILLVCTQSMEPLEILNQHEKTLGTYSVVSVEVAFDSVNIDPHKAVNTLLHTMSKHREQRGYVRVCGGTTIYLEDRASSVALKAYVGHRKLPWNVKGEETLRIEWTLKGKAVVRHIGGKQLQHLLNFNFDEFLTRNLRLETIDYNRLGKLINVNPCTMRNINLKLRYLAHCENFSTDCPRSPVNVRGLLKASGYTAYQIDKVMEKGVRLYEVDTHSPVHANVRGCRLSEQGFALGCDNYTQ